jgi:hypothetical protein
MSRPWGEACWALQRSGKAKDAPKRPIQAKQKTVVPAALHSIVDRTSYTEIKTYQVSFADLGPQEAPLGGQVVTKEASESRRATDCLREFSSCQKVSQTGL